MNLHGSIDIAAPTEAVWTAVTDPLPLAGCVPGLTQIEQLGPTAFGGSISISLGPVDGSYTFTARIRALVPPETLVATVEGVDSVTRSRVDVLIETRITPLGGAVTRLQYEATVSMTGRIAVLGEMIMRAAASALIGQVTRCLRARLEAAAGPS